MADIKTKDAIKGTIKTIDKAAVAGQRMKQAYVGSKGKAEHSIHAQEANAEEYASDRFEGGVDRVTHEAAHQFDKRATETLKNQSVHTTQNKGVKAVQEAQKTVKQTARSSGKKTIKTVSKGSAKTA